MIFRTRGTSMKRREFIGLVGSAAAAPAIWSPTARAQQAMPVIGLLGAASARQYTPFIEGFHRGLNETGYVAGRNLAIESRWADGQYDQLPKLATDLVGHRVTAIFTAGSTPATLAAKAATKTIPIVFYVAGDPVEMGLVTSLSRPGGNLTGITGLSAELVPKRLELLHQLLPTAISLA